MGIFLAAVSGKTICLQKVYHEMNIDLKFLGLFFTLCSVMVKLLKRIDPSEVLLFRALVQLVITIPIMVLVKAHPLGPEGSRLLVYLQGDFLQHISLIRLFSTQRDLLNYKIKCISHTEGYFKL